MNKNHYSSYRVRTGGDVDGCGGTEFIASQDEPHEEEPAIDQAPAEEEEEHDSGEWAAEEEYEEDEERPQTGRRTTRGASGTSDTIQTTATPGRSITLS